MRFIERIDLAILDGLYQRIADWANDRYEISCFSLCYLCHLVMTTFLLISMGLMYYRGHSSGPLPQLIPVIIIVLAIRVYFVRKEQKRLENKRTEALAFNSRRLDFHARGLRLFFFFIAINHSVGNLAIAILIAIEGRLTLQTGSTFLLLQLAFTAFGSMEYFAACTPKPPKPKREQVPAHLQPSFSS